MLIQKCQDTNLISIENGEPITTSVIVADTFNKRHIDVIRKIDTLIEGVRNFTHTPLFTKNTYVNEQNGERYPMYNMNRDGFALLVMGFTGEKALEWKLKYINAFNAMEEKIRSSNYTHDNRSEVAKFILRASKSQISAIKDLYPEYFQQTAPSSYLEGLSDVNTSYTKWIEDCGIDKDWIGEFPTTEVYNNYLRYCTENRLSSMGKKTFFKTLESDFMVCPHQKHGGLRYFV